MSETARRVIAVIGENRRRFEEFCYSLSGEQLGRPVPDSTWLVRDFAAHLGTLDPAIARWFEAARSAEGIVDNGVGPDDAPFDIDAFNDAQVVERQPWPLERVFAEAAKNREKLIETLAALTEEEVDRPMHFAGDAKRSGGTMPLKLFLAGWAQHDPIHVADMLKALPERARDPELRAWLDNPFVNGYQRAMSGPLRERQQ